MKNKETLTTIINFRKSEQQKLIDTVAMIDKTNGLQILEIIDCEGLHSVLNGYICVTIISYCKSSVNDLGLSIFMLAYEMNKN
jgi:hypothetical protein